MAFPPSLPIHFLDALPWILAAFGLCVGILALVLKAMRAGPAKEVGTCSECAGVESACTAKEVFPDAVPPRPTHPPGHVWQDFLGTHLQDGEEIWTWAGELTESQHKNLVEKLAIFLANHRSEQLGGSCTLDAYEVASFGFLNPYHFRDDFPLGRNRNIVTARMVASLGSNGFQMAWGRARELKREMAQEDGRRGALAELAQIRRKNALRKQPWLRELLKAEESHHRHTATLVHLHGHR